MSIIDVEAKMLRSGGQHCTTTNINTQSGSELYKRKNFFQKICGARNKTMNKTCQSGAGGS